MILDEFLNEFDGGVLGEGFVLAEDFELGEDFVLV
jgi:hypothetical protein